MTNRAPPADSYLTDNNHEPKEETSKNNVKQEKSETPSGLLGETNQIEKGQETVEDPYETNPDEEYEPDFKRSHTEEQISETNLNFNVTESDMSSSDLEEYAEKLRYSEENGPARYWESVDGPADGLETVINVQDKLMYIEGSSISPTFSDVSPEALEGHSYDLIERYFQEQLGWEDIPLKEWPSDEEVFEYLHDSIHEEVETEAYVRLIMERFPFTRSDFESLDSELKEEPDFPL